MNRFFNIIFLLMVPVIIAKGQVADKDRLLQVTGLINDEENNPVPGVSIISQKLRRGTISELSGIYNIISLPGDTIWFTAMGYKNGTVIVPTDINSSFYTKDIKLLNDTIVIKDVIILPWKNYEEFKREVLADKRPIKPEIVNMYDNLASIQKSIANTSSYRASPEAAYRMSQQQNTNAIMTRNQYPSNNLLNPFAWGKFFSGVRNGLLKNQKSDNSTNVKKTKKKKPEKGS